MFVLSILPWIISETLLLIKLYIHCCGFRPKQLHLVLLLFNLRMTHFRLDILPQLQSSAWHWWYSWNVDQSFWWQQDDTSSLTFKLSIIRSLSIFKVQLVHFKFLVSNLYLFYEIVNYEIMFLLKFHFYNEW